MKTLRITLIAVLVAFAAATFANADGFKTKPSKKVVELNITQAIKVPGLVIEMYNQLNDDFLANNQLLYTVTVYYGNNIYKITGTYDQWVMFFRHKRAVKEDYHHLEIDGDR
jgi:hypothetical protein